MTRKRKYPWPDQAKHPGAVWFFYAESSKPAYAIRSAVRWGQRHGYKAETRTLGQAIMIRWSLRDG